MQINGNQENKVKLTNFQYANEHKYSYKQKTKRKCKYKFQFVLEKTFIFIHKQIVINFIKKKKSKNMVHTYICMLENKKNNRQIFILLRKLNLPAN